MIPNFKELCLEEVTKLIWLFVTFGLAEVQLISIRLNLYCTIVKKKKPFKVTHLRFISVAHLTPSKGFKRLKREHTK